MIAIVYIVYIGAAAVLISCMIRNFLHIKSSKQEDAQLSRQNFFAAFIILVILIGSFIALLLRVKGYSFVSEDAENSSLLGKLVGENPYFFRYLILFILAIAAIGLFDRFFLKRNAKNERDYLRRKRFFFGILIAIICGMMLMKLIGK